MERERILLKDAAAAEWKLLADGEARTELPRSSSISRVDGAALRFRFCLEVNEGESLGRVGFVRAETALNLGISFRDAGELRCTLWKSFPELKLTIYLRSFDSAYDLQRVVHGDGPQRLSLASFRFVKWGRPVEVSAEERIAFLRGVHRFGLQVARSRQDERFRAEVMRGDFGLDGGVGLVG